MTAPDTRQALVQEETRIAGGGMLAFHVPNSRAVAFSTIIQECERIVTPMVPHPLPVKYRANAPVPQARRLMAHSLPGRKHARGSGGRAPGVLAREKSVPHEEEKGLDIRK